MDRFNRTLRGYDPDEVNKFLDQIIGHVEKMISSMKDKDKAIGLLKDRNAKLEVAVKKLISERNKNSSYSKMESSINNTIALAQKTSDEMKINAHRESQIILDNAKKNANRIVNEALLKAEKSELEAQRLERDLAIFKRKMRDLLETQLELVQDMNIEM